jgi:hypothetical protein
MWAAEILFLIRVTKGATPELIVQYPLNSDHCAFQALLQGLKNE